MCDVCPSDETVVAYLIGFSFLVSLLILLFSRKIRVALISFSVLLNGVFLLGIYSRSDFFYINNLEWFGYFSLFVWPILNIIFIILYARRKKDKQD